MKTAAKKLKRMIEKNAKYVTFEFTPLAGSFFPDLDIDFIVDGEKWLDFGAQYDGEVWRVTLYGVPENADIEIRAASSGEKIKARFVNDNESK